MLEFVLKWLQAVFLARDESEMIAHMAHLLIIFGVLNVIFSFITNSPSPYGRYTTETFLGSVLPTVSPTLGWMIQESPAFFLPAGIMVFGACQSPVTNKILIALFMFHYFHRSFVYPLYLLNGKPNMLIIVVSAVFFCAFNGFMQGYHLLCLTNFTDNYLLSARFIFGLVIFLCGFSVNVHSDYTLVHLRKPGETGYKVPKGGMFEYVSCANYFGEILEWWGFCIATWSYPAFAFAIFSTFFLAPRAIFHHRFYLQKLKNYPKHRKAVIPFIL